MRLRIDKVLRWTVVLLLVWSALFLAGCQVKNGSSPIVAPADAIVKESASRAESDQANELADMPERKISWQTQIAVEVMQVEDAITAVEKICQDQGGYVVNSSFNRQADRYNGEITIKVPQEKMETIAEMISAQGVLLNRAIQSRDVTEEYYDAEARLKVMAAKEVRLTALLSQSTNIKDLLEVENELGKVRSDIETLQGRLKVLQNTTSYATIRTSFSQTQPEYLKTPAGLSGKAGRTLINSFNAMAALFGNLIIGLVYLLPWLVLMGGVFLGVRAIRKRKISHKHHQE